MSTPPESIANTLDWLRKHFRPEAAGDGRLGLQLELSGEGGGVLSLLVDQGRLQAREGPLESPDVTYRIAAQDFFGILRGEQNPDLLFMEGRIAVDGELSQALRFRSLFRREG